MESLKKANLNFNWFPLHVYQKTKSYATGATYLHILFFIKYGILSQTYSNVSSFDKIQQKNSLISIFLNFNYQCR